MYADALLTLGGSAVGSTITGQAITATGNTLSTNVVDLSSGYAPNGIGAAQTRDLGEGSDFDFMRVEVIAAFNNATSVEFQIIQHDDTAQSVNVTVVGTTGAIPLASLVAGARFAAQINPRLASKGQRYISGRWVVVGTAPTTGTIFADLGAEIQDGQKFYPVGFAVL